MKSLTISLVAAAFLMTARSAVASLVTDAFLDTVRSVENRANQDGDQGRSRGEYQIGLPAWAEVNKLLRSRGYRTFSWDSARNPVICRQYARNYCLWLEYRITRLYGSCSSSQLYAAYNAGIARLVAASGKVSLMPANTRQRCLLFEH